MVRDPLTRTVSLAGKVRGAVDKAGETPMANRLPGSWAFDGSEPGGLVMDVGAVGNRNDHRVRLFFVVFCGDAALGWTFRCGLVPVFWILVLG